EAVAVFPNMPEEGLEVTVEAALLTLLFSALSAEASVNEIAEELIETDQHADFAGCRRAFAAPDGVAQVTWKWKKLFDRRAVSLNPSDPPLAGIEILIKARNHLVHYKPTDSAMKVIYEGPQSPV